MAKVQLANVAVLDNPSPFLNPFQFEVTFECIEELKEGEFVHCFSFTKRPKKIIPNLKKYSAKGLFVSDELSFRRSAFFRGRRRFAPFFFKVKKMSISESYWNFLFPPSSCFSSCISYICFQIAFILFFQVHLFLKWYLFVSIF